MPNRSEALVAAGNIALETGDWAAAQESFRAALEEAESPEALLGLGMTLWWLGDMDGTIAYEERAYAAFRRRPDPMWAAAAAMRLSFHYHGHLANQAAAAGWLARATRLVDEAGLDELRGELLLMQAFEAEDLTVGEAFAREALEIGRRSGDLDLELCALSQLGTLLVEQGRAPEGIALLDEAMAGALSGEGGNLETVVFASCNMIVSCTSCAEFERATQWVRAAERFAERYGCPFLLAECRTTYGAVLVATGDWSRAEAELRTAIESTRSVPAYHVQALAALAGLRLAQGRIEEAERLVAGFEGHGEIAPVLAAAHLMRGTPALAAATARRRLEAIGEDRLESALLLELLGEAEIAQDQDEPAAERGRALADLAATLGCRIAQARGERLRGHALRATDAASARRHLDAALSEFTRLGMPLEAARTRLMLAEILVEPAPDAAAAEARASLAAAEAIGAARDADAAAALLRRLGVTAARPGPRGVGTLTKREREILALLGEGLSNPEIAGRLFVSRRTVEHHVAHILAKLGLRGRAEAAAVAARELGSEAPAEPVAE